MIRRRKSASAANASLGGRAARDVAAFAALLVFVSGLLAAPESVAEPTKAFVTAMGYGQGAVGWRGGEVIHVTNLLDSGPGSLRACAERSEAPRVCIVGVSGTIVVDSPIQVRSNVYVAGQTAPDLGVQLRLGRAHGSPLVIKDSHDVVIRFLKFRPGPSDASIPNVSGLLIENSRRVMIDRCSIQFATDQNFTIHSEDGISSDITLQRSIVGWGLDRANHPKGRHSKGAQICSGVKIRGGCGRVSLVQNVFAHNRDRNPDISGGKLGPVMIINNIFYNPISEYAELHDHYSSFEAYFIGNMFIPGRSTVKDLPPAVRTYDWNGANRITIESRDNLAEQRDGRSIRAAAFSLAGMDVLRDGGADDQAAAAVPARELTSYLPSRVGAGAGRAEFEDPLDAALLKSLRKRRGRVIDDPRDVGGWPVIPIVAGPPDTDGDGMPDEWEVGRSGLDATDASDTWADRDGDGVLNLEEYLDARAGD